MGTLDYTEAMVQIDQGDISPLYLFYGEEFFLAERLVTRLRTLLVRPESAELTYYRFYGEELNLAELLDLLHSIPFFASRRLVILQHSEKLKKGDLAPLIAYCQQPLETNCLVFLAEKPNLKDPLYATIARQGRVVHLRRLYRNQLTRWLEQEARQLGYRLTPEAASALVEQGGEQLALLYSELQKVITYCGRQKQITLPDVQAVGGNDKMHSIFDLTDALARRQIGEGLKALNRLLAYGEPPLLILRMITRQFRLLWQAKVY
ncbi:MAG: DNA polymerase III subunit delta, partial [Nitrospinota bacterium]